MAEITKNIPELEILYGAPTMIISLRCPRYNIYQVADLMCQQGWHLNQLQHPSAIHLCLTRLHTAPGIASRFVSDLAWAVQTVVAQPDTEGNQGKASVYGMSQSLPDGPVNHLLASYLDLTLAS